MKSLYISAAILMSLSEPLHAQTPQTEPIDSESKLTISREGSRVSSQGAPERFTGSVKVDPLFSAVQPSNASGAYVTFSAGARTAWHTHPLGQILVVTDGIGRVQVWGESIKEIRPGDVVRIPPNTKHWHGASPQRAMTHLAIVEQQNGQTADWLEHIKDEADSATSSVAPAADRSIQPSRAQQLFGNTAPKLAELTDNVLYKDIWARSELSPRDRSLVTVSALIAMNRPDQLRSHLALARQNGVTQSELVEAITHMAFYSGWPSAVSAATIAKEVFAKSE